MTTKTKKKTNKKRKAVPQKTSFKDRMSSLKKLLTNNEENSDEMEVTRKENIRFIII